MTTIKKLYPQELLLQLVTSKSSGCLTLNNLDSSWKIYLQQGNLKYIDSSIQFLEQLEYHLHRLKLKKAAIALKHWSKSNLDIQSSVNKQQTSSDIYRKAVSWLIKEKHLNRFQSVKLIQNMTKDLLQYCLWLDRGISHWHKGDTIPAWIEAKLGNYPPLNLSKCLSLEQNRLQQWQSCSAKLFSVHQRPYLVSDWQKKTLPLFGLLDRQDLEQLAKIISGRISIRQLSLLLQKDELDVAQILSPYIEERIVYLRSPQPALLQFPTIPRIKSNDRFSSNAIHKIVCIDDSPTILKEIKRFLVREMLEVTVVDDPMQAISKIFTIAPDLILLDINMPRVNGYELCKLLRKSEKCDRIPIVMVTANQGIINKAKAKIAGANDYLTKPFTQSQLVGLVNKYLK